MEVQTKICPLATNTPTKCAACAADACAWWDSERGCCAMASIAKSLSGIERDGITTFPV